MNKFYVRLTLVGFAGLVGAMLFSALVIVPLHIIPDTIKPLLGLISGGVGVNGAFLVAMRWIEKGKI